MGFSDVLSDTALRSTQARAELQDSRSRSNAPANRQPLEELSKYIFINILNASHESHKLFP